MPSPLWGCTPRRRSSLWAERWACRSDSSSSPPPTALTDEDNLGFSYHAVNEYIRRGVCPDEAVREKIDRMHRASRFKFQTLPVYHNGLPMVIEDGTDYYK